MIHYSRPSQASSTRHHGLAVVCLAGFWPLDPTGLSVVATKGGPERLGRGGGMWLTCSRACAQWGSRWWSGPSPSPRWPKRRSSTSRRRWIRSSRRACSCAPAHSRWDHLGLGAAPWRCAVGAEQRVAGGTRQVRGRAWHRHLGRGTRCPGWRGLGVLLLRGPKTTSGAGDGAAEGTEPEVPRRGRSRQWSMESQNGLGRKGPYTPSHSNPLPWAGTPSPSPGCSQPRPAWPWTLPGRGQPQLLGAARARASPPSQGRIPALDLI